MAAHQNVLKQLQLGRLVLNPDDYEEPQLDPLVLIAEIWKKTHLDSLVLKAAKGKLLSGPLVSKAARETVSQGSINFEGKDLPTPTQEAISCRAMDSETTSLRSKSNSSKEMGFDSSSMRLDSFKKEAAAVKLQKVYKSYRTRPNLADCGVVVEELWLVSTLVASYIFCDS